MAVTTVKAMRKLLPTMFTETAGYHSPEQHMEWLIGDSCVSMIELREAWSSGNSRRTTSLLKSVLSGKLNQILRNEQGKGARPWYLADLTAGLDKNQVWVGTEYETGFATEEAYSWAVTKFWNDYENASIDGEGCGAYPCEFTLPPVNAEDFFSDEYMLDDFIKSLAKAGHNMSASWVRCTDCWGSARECCCDDDDRILEYGVDDDDENEVGIHVNFSTPASRRLDSRQMDTVAMITSRIIGNFNYKDNEKLFGRMPYGLVYSNEGGNGNLYFEAKLFKSTDDNEEWQHYKAVAGKVIELADALSLLVVGHALNRNNDVSQKKAMAFFDGTITATALAYEFVDDLADDDDDDDDDYDL